MRERLSDLGFEVAENERDELERTLRKAEQTIMNAINCESVPDELRFAALDAAAGEYLLAKERDEDGAGISAVTEGDLTVQFEANTPTEGLIDRLLNSGRDEIAAFRRVKW